MSYCFERREKSIAAVRRIAKQQVDKMLDQIDDTQADPHDTVHDVRKRCKKVRGLLRLVRPALKGSKTYEQENAWYADAARSLSYVRDSQSIIETFDTLLHRYAAQIDPAGFHSVKKQLIERRDEIAHQESSIGDSLAEFRQLMVSGSRRIDQWKLKEKGFDAVAGGLEKTYGRACDAMEQAYKEATAENFHEWRKRAKYHWYHCRLLHELWPEALTARAHTAKQLSDLLGDDHDLAILADTLTDDPSSFGESTTVEALLGLIHSRRKELQLLARTPGSRLFAEKPAAISHRFAAYWEAWKRKGKPKPEEGTAADLKLVVG